MQYDQLKKNMIDIVEEGQIKLGFREETLRLYYPLDSLNAFLGTRADAAEMEAMLTGFAETVRETMGDVVITRRRSRFCFEIPPKGVRWIWENTPRDGFLVRFIGAIAEHGCTFEKLLSVFREASPCVHAEALHNGEFDYLVYFEDGSPDAFRYCITDEGCHLTYHRFTKADYEAFGF